MHFGFWLYENQLDWDSNGDNYLDDYYAISILDLEALTWHSTDYNADDGNNFWVADEEIASEGGYLNSWIQYLDSPTIALGSGGNLSSRIYYAIEDPAGAVVDGSCTDGWDSANIRVSSDGGETWDLVEDPLNPYHFDCGYGWIWNDAEYETGGSLNHLAEGWGGLSNNWLDFSADLSGYAGLDVIIRFAFGSDPAWSTPDEAAITGFQVDEISVSDNSGVVFSDNGDDMSQMTARAEMWIDQFYDYGSCEANPSRPGCDDWEEYVPGLAFNGNAFMDISNFAEKTVRFRIQARYDDDNDGEQGDGLYIDDFKIYKISSGNYPPPIGLTAEAGDSQATLSWNDMNASGTADFVYHNGSFSDSAGITLTSEGTAWAGERFDIFGASTVNNITIQSTNTSPVNVTIGGFGQIGTLFNINSTYTIDVTLHPGENTFDVNDWDMNNSFIIAHNFTDEIIAGMDTSPTSENSMVYLSGGWEPWSDYEEDIIPGEFGISANITYHGAGVTYNVYRDGDLIQVDLTDNSYTDTGLENNVTYEYTVSASYSDGEESDESASVSATPFADSVHEESNDDGSFEMEFNAGSGNFSAVRFTADSGGEDLMRFKWYQHCLDILAPACVSTDGSGSGGAFYIKVFEDAAGIPGSEIFSSVQAAGNIAGWNEKDISLAGIVVSGEFWVGTKEFSSTIPFGLDTDTDSGNSYQREGAEGEWTQVTGNLGYRVFLDSEENREGSSIMFSSEDNNREVVVDKYPLNRLGFQNKTPQLIPVMINGKQIYRNKNYSHHLNRNLLDNRDEIILFEYDFENGETNAWSHDNGWILTEVTSHSSSHSFNSSNEALEIANIGQEVVFLNNFKIISVFPNPFNPATTIQYYIPKLSNVTLRIYDLHGRLVNKLFEGFNNPGVHTADWNGLDKTGRPVSAGIYFCKLEAGRQNVKAWKLVLLK